MTPNLPPHVLILAAGKGKRMRSSLPKVLHEVLSRPMLHHVIDTAIGIAHRSLGVVVGHGENAVRAACSGYPDLQFFVQAQQLGTGDAVKAAAGFLAGEAGSVLVLSGDVMLLRPETLSQLCQRHEQSGAVCTVATAVLTQPAGYGRILRAGEAVLGIREDVDCTAAEKQITEVNSGIYCFRIKELFAALSEVNPKNRQGEFYLTDVPQICVAKGQRVIRCLIEDPSEITGVNDRKALCEVNEVLRRRVIEKWWAAGVTIEDPATTSIDLQTQIAEDVVIEAGVRLVNCDIETGVRIESHSRIADSLVREGALIRQGSYIDGSEIGRETSVGPYAHLRPGSVLGEKVKIGNFVEIKKSTFAAGSKASHLSYIGDATVGLGANLGCGFITCNYDGKAKHHTVIGDGAFIGSDSQAVAPVTIGAGSYVAAGSTVTEDVPPNSLVLSRGRQVTKAGYTKK